MTRLAIRLAALPFAAWAMLAAPPAAAQGWGAGPYARCWQQDGTWNHTACPWMPGQSPDTARPGWVPGAGPGAGMVPGNGLAGRLDTDADGVISADEAAAFAEREFDLLDTDDDGRLTREEFMVVIVGGRVPPQMAELLARRETRMKAMDRNGDGVVDHAEFIAWHENRFDAADLDKNGKVSPWEFRAVMRRP